MFLKMRDRNTESDEKFFADKMGLNGVFLQTKILDQKLWSGGDIILEILG